MPCGNITLLLFWILKFVLKMPVFCVERVRASIYVTIKQIVGYASQPDE